MVSDSDCGVGMITLVWRHHIALTDISSMDCQKYRFWRALRPFSFTVALCACLTGIAAAFAAGFSAPLTAVLVIGAGVLLQAGVNLINDYADLPLLEGMPAGVEAQRCIRRNFQLGLGCFASATIIGFYLVAQTGLSLLWICLIGLIGALTYTLDPVNYKARGLGVVLVFWLMGVLMISGSYLAISGTLSTAVLWQSVPVSLLVALLLLSNELRDYEADRRDRIATLAGRLGYSTACSLYKLLLSLAYLVAGVLWWQGLLQSFWPVLLSTVAVVAPLRQLNQPAERRVALTPLTGRLLTLFGLLYCYGLVA